MKYDQSHIDQIKKCPHWRIRIHPNTYEEEQIPSLGRCWDIMERRRLLLRGWDYPHVDNNDVGRDNGPNWIASGSDWGAHNEYWRFYQSGQFIHYLQLYESSRPDFRAEAVKQADRLHSDGIDPRDIQGSVNIVWLLHTLTEVFAFVNGLVSEDIYSEQVIFDIKLVNISNFILTTGPDRAWWQLFRCTQNELEKTWTYPTEQLQSEYLRCAMNSIVWFLERFGWVEPNIEQLERDQYKLIRREL